MPHVASSIEAGPRRAMQLLCGNVVQMTDLVQKREHALPARRNIRNFLKGLAVCVPANAVEANSERLGHKLEMTEPRTAAPPVRRLGWSRYQQEPL